MTSRADSWGWKMEVLINTQINYRNGTLSWRSTVYLIKEEKMGGVLPKIDYRCLALRRKSILFYGKSEPNYSTKSCLNFAIMLGTILIDSNWLV